MRADPLDLVVYDPSPVSWLPSPGAAGQLVARGAPPDDREGFQLAALRALATRDDARARELADQIRSLALFSSMRHPGMLDLRCLRGLRALEHLAVQSCTGIAHAGALGALPSLRHASLNAYQRNRITGLDGLDASTSLRSLDLWWGGLGDLRALSRLRALRRLSVHDNRSFSLDGLAGLAIEELELWLPDAPCDLRATAALPQLRHIALRGSVVRSAGGSGAGTWLRSLLGRSASDWDVHGISGLPRVAIALELADVGRTLVQGDALPVTALSVSRLDDDGVRALARAPRLRTLRIAQLDAATLAPLAGHPALAELRFESAPRLAALDDVPAVRFVPRTDPPVGANRLVLCGAPVATIRGIARLQAVEHLDLRRCLQLRSLDGVEALADLRSIDLRHVRADLDVAALAGAPALQAILLNHGDGLPDERFPPRLRPLVRRSYLRGLVDRLAPSPTTARPSPA